MPKVHAARAHPVPVDRLLELQKLRLEEEEASTSMAAKKVDVNDPCAMCPGCRAKRIPANQRTEFMKNKIKSDAMLAELRELTELPACCLKSEEDKLALGSAFFIKAALCEQGLGVDLPLSKANMLMSAAAKYGANFGRVYGDMDLQISAAAQMVTRPAQLLTSVPMQIMTCIGIEDMLPNYIEAIRVGLIGLKALELKPDFWQKTLHQFDLSPWDVELCLRVGLVTLYRQNSKNARSVKDRRRYRKLVESHGQIVIRIDPDNWLTSLALADITDDQASKVKVLSQALEVADRIQEDRAQSLVRWDLCHAILLGGEGPTCRVNRVLQLVKQARIHKEVSDRWCSDLKAGDVRRYWRCLGAAGRLSGAVRRDPDVAQQALPAFVSEDELDQELVHTMCDNCRKLSEKLQKCAGCEVATYCSKDCQRRHWRAGHKTGCAGYSKPKLSQEQIATMLAKAEDGSDDEEDSEKAAPQARLSNERAKAAAT